MKFRMANDDLRNAPRAVAGANADISSRIIRSAKCGGFTLIELILVLALLVIITSIAAPAMSRFVRGRALDTEARRLYSLMHMAQSRAVSEGVPIMLWLDANTGSYGVAADGSTQTGDPKAETLSVDSTVALSVANLATGAQTTFNNLPAIRFLADGTVDENSPQTLKLVDGDGFGRLLTETRLRTGYEITAANQ